jgi:hypothetical protein
MTVLRLPGNSGKWPLVAFPVILYLEGVQFQKTAPRPGALAEYEEVRGNKRLVCVWQNGEIRYNWDHERQDFTLNLR